MLVRIEKDRDRAFIHQLHGHHRLKNPVATFTPSLRSASQNSSYSALATSGGAAEMSSASAAARVTIKRECETTSALPFMSSSERFHLPCSSSKMRRFAHFSAIDAATEEVSSRPTPAESSAGADFTCHAPSTVTFARLTLCRTARMQIFRYFSALRRLLDRVEAFSASLRYLFLSCF